MKFSTAGWNKSDVWRQFKYIVQQPLGQKSDPVGSYSRNYVVLHDPWKSVTPNGLHAAGFERGSNLQDRGLGNSQEVKRWFLTTLESSSLEISRHYGISMTL